MTSVVREIQRRAQGGLNGGIESDGYKRATICISSHGCVVNCQFCLTAKLGVKRNLTAGEIAGQVAAVLNRQRVRIGERKRSEMPPSQSTWCLWEWASRF